ncbi:MAG: hypothetical protein AAFQ04_05395 [Pseudomonadota bacterium]
MTVSEIDAYLRINAPGGLETSNTHFFKSTSRRREIPDYSGPWFSFLSKEVNRLQQLESGWDGYSSPPVKPEVGCRVINFINYLSRELAQLSEQDAPDVPLPDLFPVSGGALQADWIISNYIVEVFFDTDGTISASVHHKENAIVEEANLEVTELNIDIFPLLNMFIKTKNDTYSSSAAA